MFHAAQAFAAAAGSRAVVTGDFDADGRIDFATGNESAAAVTILANTTAFKKAAFSFKALTIPSDIAFEDSALRRSPPPISIATARWTSRCRPTRASDRTAS